MADAPRLTGAGAVVFMADIMTVAHHCGEPTHEQTGVPATDAAHLLMQTTNAAEGADAAELGDATRRLVSRFMAADDDAHAVYHAILEGDTVAEELNAAAADEEHAIATMEQLSVAKRDGESEELQFALATRMYGVMKARRIAALVERHRRPR